MKTMMPCLALTLSILLLTPASAEESGPPALSERLAALAAPYLEGEVLVGMVIGAVRGDETIVVPCGTLTPDGEARPDGDTIYEIGSMTKVLTGILLASMVGDDSVSLTDPVAALLPEGTKVPGSADDPIRLVHLATHTSGLPRMPGNFAPADPTNPYADYDAARMYAFLARARIGGKRGAKYAYSNLGAGLLGVALARRADLSYEALLRRRVLDPLGMENTRIVLTEPMRARLAPGHDAGFSRAPNWDLDAFAGAGAVRSSVNDMLRFLRASLGGGETPLAAAMALARGNHARPEKGPVMGLGWHHGAGDRVWHNGQTGGYHSFMALDPGARRGLVILGNTAVGAIDRLATDVMRVLEGTPPKPPTIHRPMPVDEEVLDACVGNYRLAPALVLTVTREGQRLLVQLTGQPRFRVYPESETEFVYRVVAARLTFSREPDGRVTDVVLAQGGREMRATRIP